MAESTDTSTSSPSSPSVPPITMGQFAGWLKKKTPELASIPDDILVKRALQSKPDLTQHVVIGEPRRKLTRDRTPTVDQRAQKYFESHPVVREGLLGAASGVGIPESQHPVREMGSGLWSTLTTPPSTADEKGVAAVGGGPALPAYRMAKGFIQQEYGYGQEVFDSLDLRQLENGGLTFDQVIKPGKGPQAAHGLAGMVTSILTLIKGGKKTPEAATRVGEAATSAAEKATRTVTEGPTVTAQRMAGTGPSLAKEVAESAVKEHNDSVAKYNADVDKVASGNAAADADFKTTVDRLNEDYDSKIADAKEKHASDVGARERSVAELQAQHADKVADARSKWVQSAYEAKQVAKEQAKVAGRKQALQSAQKSYAQMIIDNVKKTHEAVRGKLNDRWGQLREAVGVDHPVKAPEIYSAIENSRAMLAGVPADLKLFNDLVKEITEKGAQVETEQGELRNVPKESIPFDDARTQYSAVGEKAYAADGNLRRALFNVYEAYDKALSATASEAGQGKVYAGLKSDWKRYMDDWHNMSSTAKGGSPLANLYRAVDKPVAAAHVLGKFGDRLFATFARYRNDGAVPGLMAKLRNLSREEKSLPTIRDPKPVTDKATLPATPKEPTAVSPVEPKVADIEAERQKKLQRKSEDRPDAKPLPDKPGPPPNLDDIIAKTREAKIEQAGVAKEKALTPTGHDAVLGLLSGLGAVGLHNIAYAIPYTVARLGEAALVTSETGQRWLSKVTPQDIEAINKVLAKAPDKAPAVRSAITNGLIAKAKSGSPMPPLSTFQGLLTRAQLGSILRVTAPPQQQQTTTTSDKVQ